MFTHSACSLSALHAPHQQGGFREGYPDTKSNKTLTPAVLLTRDDVCKLFGISVRTTHYWIQQGRLPEPICIGAKRYWQAHHINAMLQKHGGEPLTETVGLEPTDLMPREGERAVQCTPVPSRKPKKPSAPRATVHKTESKCDEIKKRLGLL